MPTKIVLIGLRASGKTTVGAALADRLQLPFLDSDRHVETMTGRSPGDWISSAGEAAFRAAESGAIAELASDGADAVLALGGGAPCVASNRSVLADWTAILLVAPLDVLVARLSAPDASHRPALTERPLADEVALLSLRRQEHYLAWNPVAVVDTDRPVAAVVDEIVALPRVRRS